MNKEAYESIKMDVTEFDVEDVITTSGAQPQFDPNEMPYIPD